MKKIFYTNIFCICFVTCIGQNTKNNSIQTCYLFKELKFSGGPTTSINCKANFISIGKIDEKNKKVLCQLAQLHKIKLSSFNFALEFSVTNCSEIFYVPCKVDDTSNALYKLKKGREVNLKVICFKNYFVHGEIFFIVDKVIL